MMGSKYRLPRSTSGPSGWKRSSCLRLAQIVIAVALVTFILLCSYLFFGMENVDLNSISGQEETGRSRVEALLMRLVDAFTHKTAGSGGGRVEETERDDLAAEHPFRHYPFKDEEKYRIYEHPTHDPSPRCRNTGICDGDPSCGLDGMGCVTEAHARQKYVQAAARWSWAGYSTPQGDTSVGHSPPRSAGASSGVTGSMVEEHLKPWRRSLGQPPALLNKRASALLGWGAPASPCSPVRRAMSSTALRSRSCHLLCTSYVLDDPPELAGPVLSASSPRQSLPVSSPNPSPQDPCHQPGSPSSPCLPAAKDLVAFQNMPRLGGATVSRYLRNNRSYKLLGMTNGRTDVPELGTRCSQSERH
eukprot:gene19353-26003_t